VRESVSSGEAADVVALHLSVARPNAAERLNEMAVPNFRLDEKTAFITGSASGIGRAIALGIAASGANVACFDHPGADLEKAAEDIRAAGARAIAVAGDVTDARALEEAVQIAQDELGPLSLAVNSAGIANAASAEGMSAEQWQRVIDVNLTGVFLSCQAEGRAMLDNGAGAIVNIASMSGTIANRGLLQAHYNASKAGVIHLSRSLAMEWSARGLRVNSISPGYTATPMNTRPEVAERARQFETDTPLGRMADVQEIVGPAVFLLSPAASFCTGIDLVVDGGFTCW
jgi:NAD(P)-dependent dehydrogenase (short-subunit alcohol dehydrogenase family)